MGNRVYRRIDDGCGSARKIRSPINAEQIVGRERRERDFQFSPKYWNCS